MNVKQTSQIRNSDCRLRNNLASHLRLSTPHSALRTPQSNRRGILLLVVLSMLTLFLLIGTAFIVSSDQYRKANKIQARLTETSNSSIDQQDLLNEVINQLVRDTNNPNSSLRFHSLLRDMYGNDGVQIGPGNTPAIQFVERSAFSFIRDSGVLVDTNLLDNQMVNLTGNQFFWTAVEFEIPPLPGLLPLSRLPNYYNGTLLTFTDGPASGATSRIVNYEFKETLAPTSTAVGRGVAVFTLMPLDADQPMVASALNIQPGHGAIINGRPFNGTGVGYNPLAGINLPKLNTVELVAGTNRELSLLPNASFLDYEQIATTNLAGSYGAFFSNLWTTLSTEQQGRLVQSMGYVGQGGADESYDAVDFQNMLLALMPTNPGERALPVDQALVDRGPDELLGTADDRQLVIPSLHRPALINYWGAQGALINATPAFEPNMLRKVMLRPSWLDHPSFTGSNPEFANLLAAYQNNPTGATLQTNLLNGSIYGPWDVDNDLDGRRDSVWVDVGLPVMANADGRLVKPLAALLVVDMDGRLNLNAHGSEQIANSGNISFDTLDGVLAGGYDTDSLPQGQGFGPAEISLNPLMPGATSANRWAWYKRIFLGAAANESFDAVEAANDMISKQGTRRFRNQRIGKLGGVDFVPGQSGFDLLSQLKMQGVPFYANSTANRNEVLGNYVSPPDFKGRYAMPGLNDLGQPVYEAAQDIVRAGRASEIAVKSLNLETPYELDLSLGAARGENLAAPDGPYTMAELERILRPYDADAGALPSRIWDFAGEFKDNPVDTTPNLDRLNLWRTTVTTDSYDLPVPSVVVPSWMVEVGPDGMAGTGDEYVSVMGRAAVGATFADLLEYRLRADPNPPNIVREMRKLLPPDLADGLRLDINRPLGNGRDDNNNGVVDEPGEIEPTFWASTNTQLNGFTGTNGRYRDARDRNGDGLIDSDYERGTGDVNGDGMTDENDLVLVHNLRRQLLARDLYIMAMTLADPFELDTPKGKDKARQLAQWAINVVDFRDPDNIMTAFEYDVDPFDGWSPDGDIASVDSVTMQPEWAGPDNLTGTDDDLGGVVWGTERPELLITETLAWHDRRTQDTGEELVEGAEERGDVDSGKDKDFDQRFRPQGYGFLEIYNPWPTAPAANADTHLVSGSADDGVDLSKTHDGTPNGTPVWRITVYKRGGSHKDPDEIDDPQPAVDDRPLDKGFEFLADRSIYFTDRDPSTTHASWDNFADGIAFFRSTSSALAVRPGGYLVVGAGEPIGANQYLARLGEKENYNLLTDPPGLRTDRGIMLDTSNNSIALQSGPNNPIMDGNDTPNAPGDDFAVSASDVSLAIIDSPRNFSFSEPAQGYPDNSFINGKYDPPLDVPLDDKRAIYKNPSANFANINLNDGENALMLPEGNEQANRTVPGFSWTYLQRLANPLLPWNPVIGSTGHDPSLAVNPYLTVDTMGVNVTVFNGLEPNEKRWKADGAQARSNPANLETFGTLPSIKTFSSLQRGRANNPDYPGVDLESLQNSARAQAPGVIAPPVLASNLWNPEAVGAIQGGKPAGFWENRAGPAENGGDTSGTPHNFDGIPDITLGFLNEPFRRATPANETEFKKTPDQPFQWLTWNNRPFANAGELLQVPAFRPSKLLRAVSFRKDVSDLEAYDGDEVEIDLSDPGTAEDDKLTVIKDGPFGHLLNFFRTEPGTPGKEGIVGLYRILDYVHVSSPFVAAETWMNPATFGSSAVTDPNDPRYLRQPPFNKISSYREPGRVNVNTMSRTAYEGMMHRNSDDPAVAPQSGLDIHAGPTWENLVGSRRGYDAIDPSTGSPIPAPLRWQALMLDNHSPTFIASPFRSTDAGDLVPLAQLRRQGGDNDLKRSEVFPALTMAGGNLNPATQGADPAELAPTGDPLFAAETNLAFNNADRNSNFRYRPMTRLSSMTTNRSNVYAVWVTIGFFEVEEAPSKMDFRTINDPSNSLSQAQLDALYDRVYPEGYRFGKEAGSDTGDVRRVREFAMIDRTVPVAFEPGKNHNIDKTIRLRRRIE